MKEYITAAVGLLVACVFGVMWWTEKNKERPVLPPSFIEQQIKQTKFIPLTEQISKVYAVCPKEKRIADYLMSWTARVNYAIDVSEIKINKKISPAGDVKWHVQVPEITLLNEGQNLINEKDHYKFNNKLLVLMDADAQAEHYKKERERAEDIARYIAKYRIKNDKALKDIVMNQIKLVTFGLVSQVKDKKVDFESLEITVAENSEDLIAPNRPRLCEKQPFKTNLGLSEF